MDKDQLKFYLDHITGGESAAQHPYLDNTNLITTGKGINVNDEKHFVSLPWLNKVTKAPATPELIKSDYDALKTEADNNIRNNIKNNKKAFAFEKSTNIRLHDDDIDQTAKDHIIKDEDIIRKTLGKNTEGKDVYDTLTPNERAVMHDIQYSNKGGLKRFPKLITAARTNTLAENAKESDFKSGDNYNWERIVRNRMALSNQSEDEVRRAVAKDHEKDGLPEDLKPYLAPPMAPATPASQTPTDPQKAGDADDVQPHLDRPNIAENDVPTSPLLTPEENATAATPPQSAELAGYAADLHPDAADLTFGPTNIALNDYYGGSVLAANGPPAIDSTPPTPTPQTQQDDLETETSAVA